MGPTRATPTMSEPVLPAPPAPRTRRPRASDPLGELVRLERRLRARSHGIAARRAELLAGWAGVAAVALGEGEPKRALANLSRLLLALPAEHGARGGVQAVLAHVYCELGRFRRAIEVARAAQRREPRSRLAAAVAERAYASLFPVVR